MSPTENRRCGAARPQRARQSAGPAAAALDPAVEAFLTAPGVDGVDGAAVEILETHASWVVLRGDEALKVKKPVRFSYLDYSTLPRRIAACRKELALNAPAAPAIYRAVALITREADGRLAWDGAGPAVEAVLRMRRFPQDALFDALAAEGRLTLTQAAELARVITAAHAAAPVDHSRDSAADLSTVLEDTLARLAARPDVSPPEERAALADRSRAALARGAPLLAARAAAGWVRRCHGDLHLRNIVLWEGAPVLFDALEFDDALATTDVLYDLAFVLMDLLHRDLKAHANALAGVYVEAWAPEALAGLAALPALISLRAGVRAKVALDRRDTGGAPEAEARSYLALAAQALAPTAPRLIATGGLSGSGKSQIATRLAPRVADAIGALVVRSDVERKAMAGVSIDARLPPEAYTPEAAAAVYARLRAKAAALLDAGQSVLIDAVHARPQERDALEAVAAARGAPFLGLWLDCPTETRIARVTGRRGDASDAGAAVAAAQADYDLGPLRWTRIDADREVEAVAADAARHLSGG